MEEGIWSQRGRKKKSCLIEMEGAGEKAEQLRALALPENSAFVPSTHVRQFTTSSRGLGAGSLPLCGIRNTHIHTYIINL